MWKQVALAVVVVVLAVATFLVIKISPRFLIGILRYGGQAREGSLAVGDPAPDVPLVMPKTASGAGASRSLGEWIGPRPLILVFGSFT